MLTKKFIDLTPYLDMEWLDYIRPHIMYGIAHSRAQPIIVSHTLNPKYGRAGADQYLNSLSEDSIQRQLFRKSVNSRDAAIYSQLLWGQYSGARVIPITQLKPGRSYEEIENPNAVEPGVDFGKFPELMEWVRELPFKKFGRVTLFVNCVNVGTPIHRDGGYIPTDHKHEFVWVNVLRKRFFIYDPRTREREYANSGACFFDVKNWHGSEPGEDATISLRVDGQFTDELRDQLGLTGLSSYLTPDIDYAAKVENEGREHED